MSAPTERAFKGVWIPKSIWDATDITWLDKCIIAEIESLDGGDGCWADDAFLASRFGVSVSRFKSKLSELRGKGYVWTLHFDGRTRWLKTAAGTPGVSETSTRGVPVSGTPRVPETGTVYKRDTNIDTNIDTNSLTSTKSTWTDEDQRLALLLFELVAENYPFLKEKRPTYKAYEAINRLHRLDRYEYPVIEAIIRWSQQDEFWRQNIRSAEKLRKQFAQLLIRAKSNQRKPGLRVV